MRNTVCVLSIATLFATSCTYSAEQNPREPDKPVLERFSEREAITAKLADLRKIHTPEGIEVLESVKIGGVQQAISIRGRNKSNPVLVLIHGGPGLPMIPYEWAFQSPWEDFFTVVEWDQRGAGKSRGTTEAQRAALAPTVTLRRIVDDAEEVVAYVRQKLHKEKVVVMGFSWGSEVGLHLIHDKPEWISAYVGVGQAAAADDEKILFTRTIEMAKAAKNTEAVNELEALAPYPPAEGKFDVKSALAVRKWARFYNGGWYGKPDFDLLFSLPDFAPEYTAEDVDSLKSALTWTEAQQVTRDMATDDLLALGPDFKVPILFFMGRYDLHTPYDGAKAFFDRIRAPRKQFVTFERSSHFVMFEEPGRFLVELVNDVLPLTEGVATYAPER